MAILAGEIVTAGRLGRMQPRPYHAVGNADLTGAVSNADVPGATYTFTTTAANAVYTVVAVFDFDNAALTTLMIGRIAVDGAVQSPLATNGSQVTTDRVTATQTYKGTLASAGSHTIKLVATLDTGQQVRGVNSSLLITITEVV